ncbi:phosphotriesterase family protein [Runella slithyformis]|uniref:Aryldialkylphosphatase n=1 Tax=Runella slithyformis (strain ATCC 29530 / DSM 19594 / LMG 11500 / NCIMB 11436 / LSU 4) TaxID=761193 RepID=A0A7U3ZJ34_RUNSL|nr:aryldialkylphosphatase [Runella slithyformis]AEI48166.1 aryldialkylphosphatase [Runella slithyformis DSM 19594]
MLTRRQFLLTASAVPFLQAKEQIITVNGAIRPQQMGRTLIHEHLLVDFIGADKISVDRWSREEVLKVVLPYLLEVKKQGVKTFLDCTPAFLGRDVHLLQLAAQKSGLHILTNTGYYGAVDNKYLPKWAFTETAEQLADRWTAEFENGIDGTDVRPGFIKIGVNPGPLSELHRKLVRAAGLTHLRTGLTICSHTGPALAAFEEIEELQRTGVHPSAFVWVHAQGESNKNLYTKAAQMGAWVSLDGMGWGDWENYASWIDLLKSNRLLNRVLISHDAGWYKPGEPNGGSFVGFTALFEKVFPILRQKGFTQADFDQLLVHNPAEAFKIQVRKR